MEIGRFEVTIGDMELKRVRHCKVTKFTRSETRTTSFAGTDRVDRSAIKYKVSLVISICSEEEMQHLVSLAASINQDATFPFGGETVTKRMIIDLPDVPEPVYKYGKKEQGIHYINLPITMEEV